MTTVSMGIAINTWRDTYIGYSLEDMTKWWVAAKWFDEREFYEQDELERLRYDGVNVDRPWLSPYALCTNKLDFAEVLHDYVLAFDNYQECAEFCRGDHRFRGYMPLNVGDYIRWSDGKIDGHAMRKLADPIYKASQQFFATMPKDEQ